MFEPHFISHIKSSEDHNEILAETIFIKKEICCILCLIKIEKKRPQKFWQKIQSILSTSHLCDTTRRHALQYFPCSSPVSYIRFRLKSFSFSSYFILHTTLIVNNQSMFCHSHHTVTKESLIKKNQNSVINFGNKGI